MENASRAFLDAVRTSMRQIRAAMGTATVDPSLLTVAERLQYEGYLRREETNAAILSLSQQGIAIKEIVRRTGYSRGLIRKFFADSARTSSVSDKAPSSPIFPGSTSNGTPAAEMDRPYGGNSGCADFEAAFASSANGARGAKGLRRRIQPRWAAPHPPAPSRAS